MEGLIVLSDSITATNTDILQGTRLQTVPANGHLTFELSADLAIAATKFVTTIQLPDGATPLTDVLVPAAEGGAGILDDRQKLMVTFAIGQGGHVVFSMTETGAVVGIFRVTYQPFS